MDAAQRERLERTLKVMEETRKLNDQAPHALIPPQGPAADVQRTLKTIEDINRINRMNQELRKKNSNPPK
jgi:hypothetical protein